MSETESRYGESWFYGPIAVATVAKALVETDPRCKGIYPDPGEPPRPIDDDDVDGAFLVAFLKEDPVPRPEGLKSAKGSFGVPVLGSF